MLYIIDKNWCLNFCDICSLQVFSFFSTIFIVSVKFQCKFEYVDLISLIIFLGRLCPSTQSVNGNNEICQITDEKKFIDHFEIKR